MTRRTKIIIGSLTALLIMAGAFGFFTWKYINSTFNGPEACWLYLPKHTDRQAMADSLTSVLGVETGSRVYKIYCAAVNDSTNCSGAYLIQPGTTVKEIARTLAARRQTPVQVKFNNLRTMRQLADRVASQLDFSAEEFLAACDSILPAAGFKGGEEYPAAFLPDTYELYWTASPETTVKKMLDARNRFWTDERRAQAKRLGLTPVQTATLASIAEEETNDAEERATVARLYINRLNIGMPLQADPTVKFAVGDFALKRIKGNHLKTESPYNTYKHNGLPPGPIRIPEKATLRAVLDAPSHNYLYMCARPDNSGLHNFAKDLATHNKNAKAYRRYLDSLGL